MYRPNQRESCCPHYTLRLDSNAFKPTRDQRQTINRFNKYVTGNDYTKEAAKLYPRSRKEAKERDNEFRFTERVHEAEHTQLKTPPEPAHKFEVTLEEDNFTEEKWRVWDNYQTVVHKDPAGQNKPGSFKNFLCSSPLRRETMVAPDGRQRRLGSFHQCFRLDGKLVAFGVLDLLPECVSSVYFVYHESIHRHSPGKLGALHEIALAVEEGYRWWYPGFYIHSCPKMKYKNDYSPQYMLDPETLTWDPFNKDVLALLDKHAYVSLSALKSGQLAKADSDHKDGSLFAANVPGVAPISELEDVDLDHVALKIVPNDGPLLVMAALKVWSTCTIHDYPGIKNAIAELVAALGVDCVDSLCVDLSR